MQNPDTTPELTPLQALGITDDEPRFSHSQLDTFNSCGHKYELRYLRHAPEMTAAPLFAGKEIHALIARSEDEDWWHEPANFEGPEGIAVRLWLDLLHKAVDEAGGPEHVHWGGREGREDLEWWEWNGEMMLRRYRHVREALELSGYTSVEGGTEMRVLQRLPGVSRPVIGYLDKMLMQKDGEPTILDWKTGKVGGASPLQFATYARLVELAYGWHVQEGLGVYLRAGSATDAVQAVRFTELLPHVDEMYASLARGIEAEQFQPKPTAWCKSCSVRDSCWYWQATAH